MRENWWPSTMVCLVKVSGPLLAGVRGNSSATITYCHWMMCLGGDYDLFAGMYDPATGERVPPSDGSSALLPANEVPLGSVTIEGGR